MGAAVAVAKTDLNAIRFTNGAASAQMSQLAITPAGSLEVGQYFTATATILDATGNPVPEEMVSFSTSSPKAMLGATTCETAGNGTCSVQVTSQFMGDYDVHATILIGGAPTELGGGNDLAKASPQTVSFHAGDVCVSNCTPANDPDTPGDESVTHITRVEVDPNNAIANGVAADTLVVYAYDRFGNPVQGAPASATTAATAMHLGAGSTTDADGIARINATADDVGSYAATVSVDGKSPSGSPAWLNFVNGPLGTVNLTASPAGSQAAGSTYTLTVEVLDTSNNPINGAPVAMTLPAGLTTVAGAGVGSCTTGTTSAGVCALQVM
jgi:adhesin/invasin